MKKLIIILLLVLTVTSQGQRNTLGTFFYDNGYFELTVIDTTGNQLGHLHYDANTNRISTDNTKVVIDWFSTYYFRKYWETSGLAVSMMLRNLDSNGRVIDSVKMKRDKQVFDSLYNYWENR